MVLPPVDVLAELLTVEDTVVARVGSPSSGMGAGSRRGGRGSPPGPARGCRGACRSCASASARRGRARSRTDPCPRAGSRLRAQNARTLSSSAFIRFGVNTRDIRPRCTSWARRVLHEDVAGRQLDAGHDEVERRALAGPVRVPVLHGPLDVVEAAQRPEVVLLVAVERRLVPHPLPDRVRVLVDLDVERVVVECRCGVVSARSSAGLTRSMFVTPSSTPPTARWRVRSGRHVHCGPTSGPNERRATRRWHLRTVPPELVERYTAEGWWTDETLRRHRRRRRRRDWATPTLAVHSKVRPWRGTFGEVDRAARAVRRVAAATGASDRATSSCSSCRTGSRRRSPSGAPRSSARSSCRSCTSTGRRRWATSSTSCSPTPS